MLSSAGFLLLWRACASAGVEALPVAEQWFRTERLEPPAGCGYELFRTREPHETYRNAGVNGNYYLLKGPSSDLLVDAGTGMADLYAHLSQQGLIGARPLQVLATHEHFDHAGGLRHFPDNATIILGAADAGAVVHGNALLTTSALVKTKYALRPSSYWDAAPTTDWSSHFRRELITDFRVLSRVDRRVRAGDVVSLGGGVAFEVLELPGHTTGSIGLWNVNGTHELYAGDAIYDAELFDFLLDSDKSAYRATMELLLVLNASVVYPGHEEVLQPPRVRELIGCYMAGVNPCPGAAGAGADAGPAWTVV